MNKRVILLLSRVFPVYHPKRGKPTGFADNLGRQKIHTIRSDYDRWKHNLDKVLEKGFLLSVRQWSDKPYNSKQVEIAAFRGAPLGYQRISMTYDGDTGEIKAVIDGKRYTDIEQLARNNGLSVQDFKDFIFGACKSNGKQLFQGIIIHFTPYRYK